MGKHQAPRAVRLNGVARFAIPAVVGVVVFGSVTAFAASLSVTSKTLGSGNATVASCNAAASVSYTTTYASGIPGYKVATAPVTTAAGCATMAFKVTLTGSGGTSLGEATGVLDGTGAGTADFSSLGTPVSAASVVGVSVTITG
jgi:hypothetical protein